MKPQLAVGATDPAVRGAAEDAGLSGVSALGAVLSGYFMAAGLHAGVLLGPMSLVLSGFGAHRALDGRCRQPGLGAKRPRGFTAASEIPAAARVGVPTSVAAAMVAMGYDRDRKLSLILRAGIAAAKAAGVPERAAVLERILQAGAGLFAEASGHRPLLHAAGPSQGGQLTAADLRAVPEVDFAATREGVDGKELLRPPWATEGVEARGLEFVGAVDAAGVAAMLCYAVPTSGVEISEWGLLAPASAQPVMRGVQRVKAGAALPFAAPISVELDERGHPAAAASWGASSPEPPPFRVQLRR